MLRIKTKEKLNSILELQLKLHKQGIENQKVVSFELLQDCQQAAIAVGERLEREVPDRTDLVQKLEEYCEEIHKLSQQPERSGLIVPHLDAGITEVRDELMQIPAVYQAVFMPYKADMWDSLESVWMAFDKDENCEALVMPLPYSKFDSFSQQWEPCYEGERFPEYVPITDYREYCMEEECPEYIFIHNAYDEYNRVTRIDPDYFCIELKKYTDCLVYIPYFVTGGTVSEAQKFLSGYRYVDYIIVQSELYKSGFKDGPFYDKVIALGSPKLDRVIRLCNGEKQMPDEWSKVIGDRRSVMLNTSLAYFLQYREHYLRKIRSCFDWIKKNPIVAVIWRPHPLLESTIRSMHPELLPMYQELVNYFLESGIGVLDQTPDIEETIAIVDGYIGDEATSVINLFGVAGKPMFILDAAKTFFFTEDEQRKVTIAALEKLDGKLWIVPRKYNALLCVGEDWNNVQFVHRFENQPHWRYMYSGMAVINEKMYLSPAASDCPVEYDIRTGTERLLGLSIGLKSIWSGSPYTYKDRFIFFSNISYALGIYEYRQSEGRWVVYRQCLEELKGEQPSEFAEGTISGSYCDGTSVWFTGSYTNRVLRFDMETDTYEFYRIGPEGYGYRGVCADKDTLYLGEVHGYGKIVAVNLRTRRFAEYCLPQHNVIEDLSHTVRAVHKLLNIGKYIVVSPQFSDCMWRFDKETGEFVALAREFWEEAVLEGDDFLPQITGTCVFWKVMGETTLWAQRLKDDAILILDVETGEYEVKYMYLSEESYRELLDGETGFEKTNIAAPFVQVESRYFQFEDYIRKLTDGELETVKQRQRSELVTLAANMDGTCGEKVYGYLTGVM